MDFLRIRMTHRRSILADVMRLAAVRLGLQGLVIKLIVE